MDQNHWLRMINIHLSVVYGYAQLSVLAIVSSLLAVLNISLLPFIDDQYKTRLLTSTYWYVSSAFLSVCIIILMIALVEKQPNTLSEQIRKRYNGMAFVACISFGFAALIQLMVIYSLTPSSILSILFVLIPILYVGWIVWDATHLN